MFRLMLAVCFVFASLLAQETGGEPQKETYGELTERLNKAADARLLGYLDNHTASTRKEMAEYDNELAKLGSLYADLKSALDEDEKTPDENNVPLIKELVSRIDRQLHRLKNNGDMMLTYSASKMMSDAGSALGKELITTAKYREHRDLARQAKTKTEFKSAPTPEAEATLARAKQKVPSYFELLARTGGSRF